ncbi:WAS/WASL-interacting protein family member 2-like [Ahaetulla prasina]|uniref:WAS/WASL-interacting protein family member 2-like n=1 Tax=Ahaetulla prasina TaxID=499056 RepID=UPI002648F2B3|nr:WAS/WASL-interacting protein family member 2-like [Ahaetulla prasina]
MVGRASPRPVDNLQGGKEGDHWTSSWPLSQAASWNRLLTRRVCWVMPPAPTTGPVRRTQSTTNRLGHGQAGPTRPPPPPTTLPLRGERAPRLLPEQRQARPPPPPKNSAAAAAAAGKGQAAHTTGTADRGDKREKGSKAPPEAEPSQAADHCRRKTADKHRPPPPPTLEKAGPLPPSRAAAAQPGRCRPAGPLPPSRAAAAQPGRCRPAGPLPPSRAAAAQPGRCRCWKRTGRWKRPGCCRRCRRHRCRPHRRRRESAPGLLLREPGDGPPQFAHPLTHRAVFHPGGGSKLSKRPPPAQSGPK